MTLTSAGGTATLAQWQAALRAVQYSNSSDNPSTSARTVSYQVNDGTANSNTVTSTVNVAAVNDVPVLATGTTLNYTENAAATAVNTAITVADLDNATLAFGDGVDHGRVGERGGCAVVHERAGDDGQHRRGVQRGHGGDDADLGWRHGDAGAVAGGAARGAVLE